MPSRRLSNLFVDLPVKVLSGIQPVEVTGIISDSRRVQPGDLFVAVRGSSFDGHRYITDAISKGAAAVVGMDSGISLDVPYVQVSDTRQALPYIAAAFYRHPGRQLTMIGVTGTDGKTTTTNLIFHILQSAGIKAGMISTVNAVIGNQVLDTGFHVTTPEAVDVQRYLAMMVQSGLTHAVLETTSHGWAQHRVDGCEFDVAVITNITHEHLDEHGSLDNYRKTKARLFQSLQETREKSQGNPRTAVLNQDDDSYPFLSHVCREMDRVKILAYGLHTDATITPGNITYSRKGVSFTINHTATAGGLGINSSHVQAGIAALSGIPGRMEAIDLGQDFLAYVDFAHTPNALRQTLQTARQMTNGKVTVIFGSAGLRDRQKRKMMAECAVELADLSVFTAEDPRSESLADILDEMASGANGKGGVEGKNYWRIHDRGMAIRYGLSLARAGDIVLVCGKGHEQSMCFGTTEYAWDDRVALQAALAEHLGVPGPEMPFLPTQD